MTRRYPIKDVKILVGLSGGLCSFPGCRSPVAIPGNHADSAAFLGKIAHIEAHRDGGPRANTRLTPKQRDCYENWILLCPTCHELVDARSSTYAPADLRRLKSEHEAWYRAQQSSHIQRITFVELEVVTRAISSTPGTPSSTFVALDPREKMQVNDLTERVLFLLTMGLGKAGDVHTYVERVSQLHHDFPERLRDGFRAHYDELRHEGITGDALFHAMQEFACGHSDDFAIRAAGLAVLSYLFNLCEVFES